MAASYDWQSVANPTRSQGLTAATLSGHAGIPEERGQPIAVSACKGPRNAYSAPLDATSSQRKATRRDQLSVALTVAIIEETHSAFIPQ